MEALLQFIEERVEAGQHAFADVSRRMVYQRAPEWLELVDFEDDAVFLDPFLFAFLTNPDSPRDFPLAQLLWGRTSAGRRPPVVEVVSDANGVVWLSGAGAFVTGQPRRVFQLHDGDPIELRDGGGRLKSVVEPPSRLANGKLHLLRRQHPLFERFFADESGTRVDYEIDRVATEVRRPLESALGSLQRTVPRIHAPFMTVLHTVVVFQAARINSFSNPAAHGAAFLNVTGSATEAFFMEDLLHQGGHILFSALTFDPSAYLAVPEAALLRDFTANPGETRTVYAALHGVFTEALMALALDGRLRDGPDECRHEVEGRLGFILRRFGTDLSTLSHPGLFSKSGEMLFASIAEVFRALLQTRGAMAEAMNFSNQPYTFDYENFVVLNPG